MNSNIFQQLYHFFFSKKNISLHNELFNNKVIKFFLINCSWVIFFAIIYYLIDVWMATHPELAKKYFIPKWVLESKSKKTQHVLSEEIDKSKPFFYHLYFSALTQTTVGYTGQIDSEGTTISILMKDYIFQLTNFLQLITIILTPMIVFFSKNNKKKLK